MIGIATLGLSRNPCGWISPLMGGYAPVRGGVPDWQRNLEILSLSPGDLAGAMVPMDGQTHRRHSPRTVQWRYEDVIIVGLRFKPGGVRFSLALFNEPGRRSPNRITFTHPFIPLSLYQLSIRKQF